MNWETLDTVMEPYRAWMVGRERDPGPVPTMDLSTPAGILEWLSHPTNWTNSRLFCFMWRDDKLVVSRDFVWKLAPGHHRDSFVQAAFHEIRSGRMVRDGSSALEESKK